MDFDFEGFENMAKALAILVALDNYGYVDKIGYVTTKDLFVFYLREALRDINSLLREALKNTVYQSNKKAEGNEQNKTNNILDELRKIDFTKIENFINIMMKTELDKKQLREISSGLAAKALAIAADLKKKSQNSIESTS